MMIKIGSGGIKLWDASDMALWIITLMLVSNLLILLIFAARRILEKILSIRQIDIILKCLITYFLIIMPLIVAVCLYKGTFVSITYAEAYEDFAAGFLPTYRNMSLSYFTSYGNYWVFILLLIVWGFGVLFWGLREWIKSILFLKKLKACSCTCKKNDSQQLVEEIQKELNIRKKVTIWMCDMISTPFAVNTSRPNIFFPVGDWSKEERYLMFRHELIHCKREDPLYRKMIFWLCSLNWFNPIMHFLTKYCIDINEMACDDMVLEGMSKNERLIYAKTLANMALVKDNLPCTVSMTGHTESQLERRLKNMLREKNKANKIAAGTLGLLLSVAFPLTTLAASAGISKVQDTIVNDFMIEATEEYMEPTTTLTEITEPADNLILTSTDILLTPRSSISISAELVGTETKTLANVAASANMEVHVYIKSTSSQDNFKLGYKTASGTSTYVTSSNGTVNHSFTLTKAGTYTFYVTGISNAKTISLAGSITTL